MEIFIDKARKCRGKQALYFTIPKGLDIYELDCIHPKHYDSRLQVFETSLSNFSILLDKFIDEDIKIPKELPNQLEKELDRLSTFDKQHVPQYKTNPFSYQAEGVNYGLIHPKYLLGDQMGLGKSKQAIDLAVARKINNSHCLVVCGVNDLKYNWRSEVSVHSNEQSYILGTRYRKNGNEYIGGSKEKLEDLKNITNLPYFIITNIETLRNKDIANEIKKLCDKDVIIMTIIDEAHKAKNHSSQQGKSIHKCTSYYRLPMTGSPLMNSPLDLYNILKWIDVVNIPYGDFESRYTIKGGFGGYEIVDYKNLDILNKQVQNCMLRRLKNDVLDLPDKIQTYELLEMGEKQQKLYNETKQHIIDNIDKVILSNNPLAELIRLRQCTADSSILSTTINDSVKVQRLISIVEELAENDRKCIIFSNWTSVTDILEKELKQFNPAIATGKVKNTDKEIQKFKTDDTCKCIIGTIGVLGTGFTLTEADTVIFMDEPWSYADKEQAEDRAYRISTKSNVTIITLLCKGTIDEKIAKLVQDKKDLSDMIIDNKDKQKKKDIILDLLE